MLPRIIQKNFHIKKQRLQFLNVKSEIKVCHPREMDVVEAEWTKLVTLPICEISIREEGDETWQVGVYWSAVRVRLGYVSH